MTKEEFKTVIEKEIEKGISIGRDLEYLDRYEYALRQPSESTEEFEKCPPKTSLTIYNDLIKWYKLVKLILDKYLAKSYPNIRDEFRPLYFDYNSYEFTEYGVEGLAQDIAVLESILERLPYLEDDVTPKDNVRLENKPNQTRYKVFISHSSKDKKFVNAFVDLLEFIGINDNEKLFCSSVTGYMIPNSENICECLREQFNEYKLFVIFVHSHNYYASPYSMNEMGAAWSLGSKFYSLLVKGFDFKDMKGVIDDRYTSIKVDADDVKIRLNGMKEQLISTFRLASIDESKWEDKRDKFLDIVNNLPTSISQSSRNGKDKRTTIETIFNKYYRNIFYRIFDCLDIENYSQWMYKWANPSHLEISLERYEKIKNLIEAIKNVIYREEFSEIHSLLMNFSLLLKDFMDVCDTHKGLEQCSTMVYMVVHFSRWNVGSPNTKKNIEETEFAYLVQDLSLELTRLLNLLLAKVDDCMPDIIKEYYIVNIDGEDVYDVQYREHEISLAPYPGLEKFVEETRFSRTKCYGTIKDFSILPLTDLRSTHISNFTLIKTT